MKKILVICLYIVALSSCKEYSYEGGPVQPGPGTPTTPTNPTNPTNPGSPQPVTCFECDYSPICDSTTLLYLETAGGSIVQTNYIYRVQTDTTLNGASFKRVKVTQSNGGIEHVYFGCSNQVLQRAGDLPNGAGGTTFSIQTLLKANEPIGSSWSDILPTRQVNYSIIEKNSVRQVLDSVYSNVIYVRDTIFNFNSGGSQASGVRHTYYANGIGVIEAITDNFGAGSIDYNRKLISYRIR